jgi:ribonuclease HI
MNTLSVYTDGACRGNPGPGGWGAVLLFEGRTKELSGFDPKTTNNRMELTAVIAGLSAVKSKVPITVYSDSKYVVDAITQGWISCWVKNGWKTAAKKPVANRVLWEQLIKLNAKYDPKYIWVKGHADNEYNNRCDELAVNAITVGLLYKNV